MSDMIAVPSHVMVTIRRPNGDIEVVNYTANVKSSILAFDGRLLAFVNRAMATSGRGQIISYENITKVVEAPKPTTADLAEMAYIRETNAIYGAGAGGERCDKIGGADDVDHSPDHPTDY